MNPASAIASGGSVKPPTKHVANNATCGNLFFLSDVFIVYPQGISKIYWSILQECGFLCKKIA